MFLIGLANVKLQAKNKLDSMWQTWVDKSQPDTIRLQAIGDYAYNGYLFNKPDSAFYFAGLQLEFAEKSGLKDWQASALLTQGSSFYVKGENKKALEYYYKSLKIQQELKDKKGIASCLGNIGVIQEMQGDHVSALENYNLCLKYMRELGDKSGVATVLNNIGIIYDLQQDYKKAKVHYEECLEIQQELGDKRSISGALNNLGGVYSSQDEHDKAIEYYTKSLSIQKEIGNNKGAANALSNIGVSYKELGDLDLAEEYFQKSLKLERELNNKKGLANTLNNIGSLYLSKGNAKKAISYSSQALAYAKEIGAVVHVRDASKVLFKGYKILNNNKKALEMYEIFILMRDSVLSEKNQEELIHQEYKIEYEKNALADSLEFSKQKAIQDLVVEKQNADLEKQKIGIFALVGGALLTVILAITIFRGKKRSDNLLLNILPEETAAELKAKGRAEAKLIEQTTVLFTDFKDFTSISESLKPKELVENIHECFSAFDAIMEKHQVEKIKTIGDSYMAAGGLHASSFQAENVVLAAMDILAFMGAYSQKQRQKGKSSFDIRIGIHTGPVVAGIVGVKKFQYDIWGDTVNTASRMESAGVEGKINISKPTYLLLKDNPKFAFENRGAVEIKGKAAMEMYFVQLV